MSVQVNTYGTDDGIMGTLVLTLHDPASEVATVRFRVTGADGIPSSPVAADRVPSPGVYEKDVALALDTETLIEPVVTVAVGGTVPAEAQSFRRLSGQMLTLVQGSLTERGSSLEIGTGLALGRTADGRRPVLTGTGGSGTGGTLEVQDADTTATAASTLAFQGTVVSVANGVATFNLDGRYVTHAGASTVLASYYTRAESDGRYAPVAHTHTYLPLAGGVMSERLQVEKNTVDPDFRTGHVELRTTNGSAVAVGFHRSMFSAVTLRHGVLGALDLVDHSGVWAQYRGSSFWAVGNRFHGGDGAFIDLTNGAAQFVTSGGTALQGRFGALLLGNDYGQAANVPANGLYVAGGTSLAALTTRELLKVDASMRLANGGVLQAQRTDGAVDPVFWPRWTDNNTYLNYGGGGHFFIRDNASIARMIFDPNGAGFTTWVQARGVSYDLRLGGARSAAHSQVTSTPSLHLDCTDGWQTYINHSSGRPTNIGGIEQSLYKLAVNGDAILHNNGWFRNANREVGLYNQALDRHLYAGGDGSGNGWQITGGPAATFLALRGEGTTSAIKGWLYADANGYGLLSGTRSWAVRTYAGGVQLYGDVLVPGQLVGQGNWGVVIGGSTIANRRVRVGEVHDDSGMFALDARNLRLTATVGKEVRLSIEDVIRLRVHDSGVQMHGSVAVSDGNVAAADFVLT